MLRKGLASLLYSPWRLLLAAVAGGCLIIGAFLVLGHGSSPDEGATPPRRQQEPTAQPAAAKSTYVPGATESGNPAAVKARSRVLQRFLRGFADEKKGAHRSRNLQQVTTPALWRGLKESESSALPQAPVRRVYQRMGGAYAAEYLASTATGDRFLVDLVLTPDGWRVCDVEPQHGP